MDFISFQVCIWHASKTKNIFAIKNGLYLLSRNISTHVNNLGIESLHLIFKPGHFDQNEKVSSSITFFIHIYMWMLNRPSLRSSRAFI